MINLIERGVASKGDHSKDYFILEQSTIIEGRNSSILKETFKNLQIEKFERKFLQNNASYVNIQRALTLVENDDGKAVDLSLALLNPPFLGKRLNTHAGLQRVGTQLDEKESKKTANDCGRIFEDTVKQLKA